MKFQTDKQTLTDLNLVGKYNKRSIFSIYNKTITKGGERLLEKMFKSPFTNTKACNGRASKFEFFINSGINFPFSVKEFNQAEDYLASNGHSSILASFALNLKRKFMGLIAHEGEYNLLQSGFKSSLNFFSDLNGFVNELGKHQNSNYQIEKIELEAFCKIKQVKALVHKFSKNEEFSFYQFCKYDYILRHELSEKISEVMHKIYELDVYTSVAEIARTKSFSLPNAIEPIPGSKKLYDPFMLDIKEVGHPGLENAVSNPINISSNENIIFLTGANMAGKSTLMKSFSIAVYLAHMGFPVPAKKMDFTMMEGLYTSINVPDDLNMGYSHFYAEVMRVKMIAEKIANGKRLAVLFDEMFKGTNVKDAYDATVCLSECFSQNQKCAYIVSTHIMEAAQTLQKKCKGIQYKYLPTAFSNGKPSYSYTLQDGISNDHFGMHIVNNEKIIEIIKQSPFYSS